MEQSACFSSGPDHVVDEIPIVRRRFANIEVEMPRSILMMIMTPLAHVRKF
jgi:hypothetical protein